MLKKEILYTGKYKSKIVIRYKFIGITIYKKEMEFTDTQIGWELMNFL